MLCSDGSLTKMKGYTLIAHSKPEKHFGGEVSYWPFWRNDQTGEIILSVGGRKKEVIKGNIEDHPLFGYYIRYIIVFDNWTKSYDILREDEPKGPCGHYETVLGPFETEEEAFKALEELKNKGGY